MMSGHDNPAINLNRTAAELRQDPSIAKLLSRMPTEIQHSFSEPQLAYLRLALGARQWGKHSIDCRGTVGAGKYRYYWVMVAGRNIRDKQRFNNSSLYWQAILLSILLVSATLLGLVVLYLLKSALGIDLFAGFSLGIWDWFKQLFQ